MNSAILSPSDLLAPAATVPEVPTQAPDFTTWSRASLEQFATDANNQNLQLKADLRMALDNYRKLLKKHNAHRPVVT